MSDSLLPDEIVDLARRVVEENRAIGRKIVVAESCTGGLVAAALTEIPGSSAVLDRGFVTYSNEAKKETLGVASDVIDAFGAVSIACVYAMAQGALERSDADVAVAISGIAGPDGGSPQKPIGTVVFARAFRDAEERDAESKLFEAEDRRGDAVRARAPAAVKVFRARFERGNHLAEGAVEILARERFEHQVLELEVHAEVDLAAAVVTRFEFPDVVEVLERPVDVDHLDPPWSLLVDARSELLPQCLEPDEHVGDHFGLAVGTDARSHDPRQELAVAADIGHQVEHLLAAVGQPSGLANSRHQIFCLTSFASRRAFISAKSSPAW
jgi:nicotinamide-nucleotide amidase